MPAPHASSARAEPYGFWPSGFSAAQAAAASRDFAELRAARHGLLWSEYRPEDARTTLWHWCRETGTAHRLTPEGVSLRSRVNEYGGGSFCATDQGAVFVNEADQQLYIQQLDSQPLDTTPLRALTADPTRRYGGLHFDVHGHAVLAVEETHGTGEEPYHRLVAIALDDGRRTVIAEGADFYADPAVSHDGRRLAWIEWDHPHQPWTATRLMTAVRTAGDTWHAVRQVAGGTQESLQQPGFDARGRLLCLSDRGGWWQPWRERDGVFAPLPAANADHASAPWQLGARTWLALDDDTLLASWLENGFGVLGRFNPATGTTQRLAETFTHFRQLAADDDAFYCIAAAPDRLATLIAIDRTSNTVTALAGGEAPLPDAQISRPLPLRYPTGPHPGEYTQEAHGFFYPPAGVTTANDAQPPLVVFIHGGPTAARYPVFDPRIQFWTQRGFAVADLNYRGSSGYGRAYRQRLHDSWGVVDVEDACAVVAHLAAQGQIDPARAFIRGGSAGGYTVLCALAFRDVFRAGASLYGVSDPLALGRATHKFESRYLDWLIGDPERDTARYHARTPLRHADAIHAPVIFFQGELDAVVVPEQTESMVAALRQRNVAVDYHAYPGERHGFRQANNIAHALEREWRFYQRWL